MTPFVFERFQALSSSIQNEIEEARQKTRQLMELGIDISDPCVVTPLEMTVENYPEIAEYCNDILIELVKEQMDRRKKFLLDRDEEILDEF